MELSKKNQLTGILWAALSVVCWGTLFPAVSFLLKRGNIDCYSMGQFRFTLAGCVILIVHSIINRSLPIKGICGKDWLNMIIFSLFTAGMSCALFYGQSLGIPVVNAAMLESEAPLLIFILGIIILHNKTSLLQILGLLFGFAGSMFVLKVISSDGFMIKSFRSGDLMVVIAAVCWALYTVLSNRTIKRIGGLLYSGWSVFFCRTLDFDLSTGISFAISPADSASGCCLCCISCIDSHCVGVLFLEQCAAVYFHRIACHFRVFHADPDSCSWVDSVWRENYTVPMCRNDSGIRFFADRTGNCRSSAFIIQKEALIF